MWVPVSLSISEGPFVYLYCVCVCVSADRCMSTSAMAACALCRHVYMCVVYVCLMIVCAHANVCVSLGTPLSKYNHRDSHCLQL